MNQLKIGVVLNYLIITLNIVIGLVYTPFLLKMLGQSEYGMYSLAQSVITYLVILDLGFGNAVIRYTAKFRAESKTREAESLFGMFLLIYGVIAIVAFIAGTAITMNLDLFFSNTMTTSELKTIKTMLWLMTFNVVFTFPMSIWGNIMTAYERFAFLRLVRIATQIANPLAMFVLLLMGHKAISLVVLTTILNVITLLFNFWYCSHYLKIHIRFDHFDLSLLREVGIYALWIFVSAIVDRFQWYTGQFVLGIYHGTSAIAIYALAIQLVTFYMMFSTAISSVFLPKVTKIVTTGNDIEQVSNLFLRTGRIQYVIMALVLSGYIVFGQQFIYLWVGPDYSDSFFIALLLMIPLTVPLIQNLGLSVLEARNKMRFRALLYFSIALVALAVSFPLAKYYQGIGTALATMGAMFVGHVLIMNIYYYRAQKIDIPLFWKNIIRMSIAPFFLVVASLFVLSYFHLYANTWSKLFGQIAMYLVTYFVVVWFLSLNVSERMLFSTPIKKIVNRFCNTND